MGQDRIDDRHLRSHERAGDSCLATSLGVGDDSATGDLGAGAGTRRKRDERDGRLQVGAIRGEELAEAQTLLSAQPRGLRRVDDGAAAEGDDRLGTARGERRGGGVDHVDRGLACGLVIAREREPELGLERVDHGGSSGVELRDAVVDEEQDRCGPEVPECRHELGGAAVTEAHLDRQVVVERRHAI